MHARRWVAGVLTAALAVGACGDDDDADLTYTADALVEVLVREDDLGSGWSEDRRDVFTTRAEGPPSFDPGGWCPDAAEEVEGIEALAGETGAVVELSRERQGRSFHGLSEQLWSNMTTAEYFATVVGALDTCMGATWFLEDEGEVTVGALEGPSVGDESTMALVEVVTPGPDGDYVWRSRVLVARFGTTLMVLDELDVQIEGSAPRFTDADWSDVVDTATEAVERLTAD